MSIQTQVDTYALQVLPGPAGFTVFLVNSAQTPLSGLSVTPTGSLQAFSAVQSMLDLHATGQKTGALEPLDWIEAQDLSGYAAFKSFDPRGRIVDAAYNWLFSEVLPQYDQPTLDFNGEAFVLSADGKLANPNPRAGRTGSGRARPKSGKRMDHFWI